MRFSFVLGRLEQALAGPLPGPAAQDHLSPIPRRQWPDGIPPSSVRLAAGLLLVFPIEEQAHVVLTVRAPGLGRHSGQVSLPGGVVEPGETFEQAALREAHEEVGLNPAGVRALGALTPIDIPVSGFRLHPIVGALDRRPELAPSDGEVARILEVPLAGLAAPASVVRRAQVRDGRALMVPAFDISGHEIWGATAMVLAELLTMLGWSPAPPGSSGA